MLKTIALMAFVVMLLVAGAIFLLFPHQIQRLAIKYADQGLTSRIIPLKNFVGSPVYLVNVRIVGLGAILMGLFLLWASTRSR